MTENMKAGTARRRAGLHQPYYIIWNTPNYRIQKVIETGSRFDDEHFESGNYYLTEDEPRRILEKDERMRKSLAESERRRQKSVSRSKGKEKEKKDAPDRKERERIRKRTWNREHRDIISERNRRYRMRNKTELE